MQLKFLKAPQITFLREGNYINSDESPEQRFEEIIDRIRDYEDRYGKGLADRMSEWIGQNYISLSTPTITNFGRKRDPNKNTYPLPVSCNIVTIDNSIASIFTGKGEVAMLSKLGAGVGVDYQLVAQKGTVLSEKFFTNSKLDWIEDAVSTAQKVSQGSSRRGYCTPFLSIEDADFDNLMLRISKKNPDKKDPLINNTIGIILPKGFRDKLKTDKESKRRYLEVLEERRKTGKVYMLDVENLNKNCSPVYSKLGLEIATGNICTEFTQPLFPDMTSACVLAALNLVHWDIIKTNPQIIEDAFTFLDILNEEYILLTEGVPFMEKARKAAIQKRDIGLGTLGFHEYIQSKGAEFGDILSRSLNKQIFSSIREIGEATTTKLAVNLGSAPICEKARMVRRNASLMMVAPNKSTSFISGGTSLGIEPFMSNIFFKSLAKIQHVVKNSNLEKLLDSINKNTLDIWKSIEENNGSVQHLDFLTPKQKGIFKTFAEISPKDIIDLASDRQKFIDMSQSLNLVIRKNYSLADVAAIHKYAWEKEIKTLYYAYPSAHAALEKDGEKWDNCASCAD